MSENRTAILRRCLAELQAGDLAARDALLGFACDRLLRLTRALFADFRRLRRWEDSGDVCHNATLRLRRRLADTVPTSLPHFYRMAAQEIRRELLDLVRHYFGPQGLAANQESAGEERPAHEPADSTWEPEKLCCWSDFHRQAEALPEKEREVFDLLFYQGLKQAEAADVLGVTERTIRYRWQAACLKLCDALGGTLPGL
jgi:RNA polymerase sigma-70 factor (ECF subfamily)